MYNDKYDESKQFLTTKEENGVHERDIALIEFNKNNNNTNNTHSNNHAEVTPVRNTDDEGILGPDGKLKNDDCCGRCHVVCIAIFFTLLIGLTIVFASAAGPPKLHFSNALGSSMVLSRNGSVIWGYSPNKQDKIDIYLSDKLIGTVIADYAVPYSWKDDVYEWQFAIPALKPDESVFGPHTIIVEGRGNEDEGKVKAKLEDIYFGETFLCSGQSNMEFTVGSQLNATEELKKVQSGQYDLVRFMVAGALNTGSFMDHPTPEFASVVISWTKPLEKYFITKDCKVNDGTKWNNGISAVCWDFGRRLYEENGKKLPIGLVDSSYGGTSMSYWSTPESIQTCSDFTGYYTCTSPSSPKEKSDDNNNGNNDEQEKRMNTPPASPAPFGTCSGLYNGMIFPLRHMIFSGIAWYQGENDVPQDGNTDYFKCAFKEIIKTTFRNTFGTNMPFVAVQLAPYNNVEHVADALPNTRAVQQDVVDEETVSTALVTTIDLGDSNSDCASGDIHPRHKEEVGERLSRFFMYYTFKASATVLPLAPVASNCVLTEDDITIVFNMDLSSDSPTVPTACHDATTKPERAGGRCVPSGYEVFYNNKWEMISKDDSTVTKISDQTIRLSVPNSKVWPSGTSIRYAWSDFPAISLYSKHLKTPLSQFVVVCKR